MVSY